MGWAEEHEKEVKGQTDGRRHFPISICIGKTEVASETEIVLGLYTSSPVWTLSQQLLGVVCIKSQLNHHKMFGAQFWASDIVG